MDVGRLNVRERTCGSSHFFVDFRGRLLGSNWYFLNLKLFGVTSKISSAKNESGTAESYLPCMKLTLQGS